MTTDSPISDRAALINDRESPIQDIPSSFFEGLSEKAAAELADRILNLHPHDKLQVRRLLSKDYDPNKHFAPLPPGVDPATLKHRQMFMAATVRFRSAGAGRKGWEFFARSPKKLPVAGFSITCDPNSESPPEISLTLSDLATEGVGLADIMIPLNEQSYEDAVATVRDMARQLGYDLIKLKKKPPTHG